MLTYTFLGLLLSGIPIIQQSDATDFIAEARSLQHQCGF